jgi:3-hydroxyacyl-CoA dehydrogenase/enoyl-CoA hydratase/3-hydroxybutyryl-CoA epimerase
MENERHSVTGADQTRQGIHVPADRLSLSHLRIEKTRDGIVLVVIDSPGTRVNKVSSALLGEIETIIDSIERDVTVRAMAVVSGKDDNFIVGADIDELKATTTRDGILEYISTANSILNRVERLSIPVVAGINGNCLGGGLEFCLAAKYRMATDSPGTVMGLPEVQLGLFPAGGGTQRLPRLIGLTQALPLLLTAKNVRPRKARKLGLIDEIVFPYAIRDAAVQKARELAGMKGKIKRRRGRSLVTAFLEGTAIGRRIVLSQARKMVMRQTHGLYPAPLAILDSVDFGYRKGVYRGIEADCGRFADLVFSRHARSLMGLFFAMTEAKKNPRRELARQVKKLAVLGAGLMGSGIAAVSVERCDTVLIKDTALDAAARGMREVWKGLEKRARSGGIPPFERDTLYGKMVPCDDYSMFAGTDLVVEAVFEDLALKRRILSDVERATGAKTIFASNTSALPIREIAAESLRPENVIGMHYFSPVQRMPLLEIITTSDTADWVTATTLEFGIRQGKTCIVVKDGPGFYTTRILAPMLNEAVLLIEEGVDPAAIDRVMLAFGYPVGPIALMDEVGIDVGAHVSRGLGPMFEARGARPSPGLGRLYEKGFHGKKNKKGFYRYDVKKRKGIRQIDCEVLGVLNAAAPRKTDEREVRDRVSLMMVNEALLCLQEGIIASPRDGDTGAILGLGFPPFRGGPFRHIDTEGADVILGRMDELAATHGERFKAAGILRDAVSSGRKFYP